METATLQTAYLSPIDREKMDAIIKATCQYYDITETELRTGVKSMEATAIRRECFYLILTNTQIKPKKVGSRLGKSRQVVLKAFATIEVHKKIYGQTRDTLRAIVAIANTFEKTSAWHIQ